MIIQHATILTPLKRIEDGVLLVDGRRITAIGRYGELPVPLYGRIIDGTGMYLVPGFIDLQVNGAFGRDFTTNPESIWSVGRKLPRYGVTSFLPTIITSPLDTIAAAQKAIASGPPPGYRGARPLGLHLEGPFLNPLKKGAHTAAYLKFPTQDAIRRWSPDESVRLVTLAPELPGALELTRILSQRGVVVGSGHSMATFDEARAGVAAGIRYGTHLFNAMPPLHHRRPGLAVALLAERDVIVGLIADGLHIHPAMVRFAWQAAGISRLNLVTDAMAGLGMPHGRFQLGDQEAKSSDSGARLEDGTLAGSTLSLDRAVRNLMRFTGCTLEDALPAVTSNPAQLLGEYGEVGSLVAGAFADFVLLSQDATVMATVARGDLLYEKTSYRQC